MTELLAESPLIVSLMLGVLAIGLLYGWLQTGKKPLAAAGLLVALCVPAAWAISENWVTDRERIEMVIHQLAIAVESNDHDTALAIIADEATQRQAAAELPQWIFSEAKVGSIRSIDITNDMDPAQADVDMTVKVQFSSKRGGMQNIRVPRRLLLTFEKRGDNDSIYGGWVVIRYRHLPIVGNADGYTTTPIPTSL
ncbi:hypothetical protein [Neorhodopirellula lusitana]|uniref:hypothetical protein n=1 Tax=Neorhodopirellula lusitana TaxID=445327 RepID=UPI00384E0911